MDSMVPYTLYCRHGYLFRSGMHFLQVGVWMHWLPDMVILQHGLLTETEYRQIQTKRYVNVYQDSRYSCVSITVPYVNKYVSRVEDQTKLTQYIGKLVNVAYDLWCGEVNVK